MCARAHPSLRHHIDRTNNIRVICVAAINAAEQRLSWTIALVCASAIRASLGRKLSGHGNYHAAHFVQRFFDGCPQCSQAHALKRAVERPLLPHVVAGVLIRSPGAFRHIAEMQVLDVYAAVLLRERMRRPPVKVLSNRADSLVFLLYELLEPAPDPARLSLVEFFCLPLCGKLLSRRLIERQTA